MRRVALTQHPDATAWLDFAKLMRAIEVPGDFMADRPMNAPPREHDLFEDA
jgi:antitoxin VapB